jgi:ArsR family transcriptional regulator, arsenate/arsenite/antimonite-responsive transcriptional repressor
MNESIEFPPACCTLDIDGRDQNRLVQMFKALGNPLRFEIMKYLVTHPGCITGDIVAHLPVAQATVSQHLKVLRDAGWVEGYCRRAGDPLLPERSRRGLVPVAS